MTLMLEHAVCVRSYPGASRGGDFGMVIPREGGALAALVDASGHGLSAYAVALTARRVISASSDDPIEEIFGKLDAALHGTIGAAISIATITEDSLAFAGVGNVSAYVGGHELPTRFGVVGQHPRPPVVSEVALPVDTWLLMHTDGVRTPDAVPRGAAEPAAAALIKSHGQPHDDAAVLLLRWRQEER